MTAAYRAGFGKLVGLCVLRPLVHHDADDLGDHVAGALHHDGIADAKIDAVTNRISFVADPLDVILIMQRRVRDDDAADRDRLEPGHRRQRAGAADLDIDAVENGHRLLRREFVRDRPARAARHEAETVLPVEPVDLVDHAVDVVAERGALFPDLAVEFENGVDVLAELCQWIDDEARLVHPLQHAVLGIGRTLTHLAPGIGEEFQGPRRRDRDVLLAQRSRRRIARIGEHRIVGFRLLPVQLEKILLEHVDFAAHFACRGNVAAFQRVRNILDGAHIGGDILAGKTVAARRRADQFAVFVAQRQRQAVDLRFGDECWNVFGIEFEKAPDALDEFRHLLVAESITQRQHGNGMLYFRKAARRRSADLLRRRFLTHKIREFRLDRLQPLAQRVIGRIRYGRRVLLIVAFVMPFDLKRQPHQLDLGLRLGEFCNVGGGSWFCCPGHGA